MDELHKQLGTIVPRENPVVWLQDTNAVVIALRKQPLQVARQTLRDITTCLPPSTLRGQYEQLLNEVKSMRVTKEFVASVYDELKQTKPNSGQSTKDKKKILALLCTSVILSTLPAEVKGVMGEVGIGKGGPLPHLVVNGSKVKLSTKDGDEQIDLSDSLKADVLWSLKLYPRDFLLCKISNPGVQLGRNHLSKFLAEVFKGRSFRLAELL